MSTNASNRHAERGQTLPMWTFAVLTALTLMFFALNYANVVRWQVRAQNAADAAATAALTVQATQWNKMNALLYAADVEEWRIRHLIQGMIDAGNQNGGCTSSTQCLAIYNALVSQYYKAVNRYSTDIQMLQSLAAISRSQQQADATKIIQNLKATCGAASELADCAFTYHIVDYSYRTTTQQAGKDAFYVQLGGFSSAYDTTPVADWEPARMEIATCATVQPLINFSIFGYNPSAGFNAGFKVIGRAAATNVSQTAEWFMPGISKNPGNGNAVFQAAENYDPTDDTFAGTASPRDFYETNFPGNKYTAYIAYQQYSGYTADDFEVMLCWWAAIPYAPYSGSQTADTLCTQS